MGETPAGPGTGGAGTGGPGTAGPGWPHPFRLPSGTSLRFALLILSVSAAMAWSIGGFAGMTVYFGLGGDPRSLTDLISCVSAEDAELPAAPLAVPAGCGRPSFGDDFVLELAGLAVLAVAVGVVHWLLPAHRIRHRRLRPLRADAHPEVGRALTALVARAGLRCRVRFVVDWRDNRPTGLAFGRVGRRHVMLSGGLLRLHRRDPEAFEAIVLHELAHLRNRDVDIAFLTLICHRLFLVAFAAPTAVLAPFSLLVGLVLFPGILPYQLLSIVTQCALAVSVAHTSSAVLRSRELYADARVALWTSGARPLQRLLAAQHRAESAGRRPPLFLRTHPSAARRLRALDDTRLLFELSAWEAFGLVLSCSLAYQQVAQWAERATGLAGPGSALSAVVPSLLLGGGLAAGIWRVTLAAHLRHTRWAEAHRTGLAVGGGLVLGALGDEEHRTALAMGIADPVPVALAWSLLLCAVGYAFVRWNAVAARVWAPAVLAARRPLLPVLAGCAAGVVLLSFWLGHAYDAGQPGFALLPLPPPLDALPSPFDYLGMVFSLAVVATPAPGVLAVVGLTIGFPLAAGAAARLSRRRPHGTTAAAGPARFLLRPPPPETAAALLVPPRLRPARAVLEGVVAGTAAGVALWLAHVVAALTAPGPVVGLGTVFPLYFVAAAAALQLAVGSVVSWRSARAELRSLHGVLGVLGSGPPLVVAAFTARDNFACLHWGLGDQACSVVQHPATVAGIVMIMAWTSALALLLLPAWAGLADGARARRAAGGRGAGPHRAGPPPSGRP